MMKSLIRLMLACALAGVGVLPMTARAHCDALDGPVVTEARAALEKGDVAPVLKWVRATDEAEVRAAFDKTRTVRALGPEAKSLADTYFFETLVRIHRAGEDAPYTGLKPAGQVAPAVAAADKALATGKADPLVKAITEEVAQGIRARFAHVREAKQHKDESVAAGRAYVAAYVEYVHYVEGLHAAIAGPAHHSEDSAPAAACSDCGHGE